LWFRERYLELLTAEAVPAVRQAVGPGNQRRTVRPVADRLRRVRIEYGQSVGLEQSDTAADFDDDRALVSAADFKLCS
jgi:hypothetical protein